MVARRHGGNRSGSRVSRAKRAEGIAVTWGRIYWPLALIAASLLFGPAELIALFTNSLNTLSDYSEYELGILDITGHPVNQHTVAWFLTLAVWVLFAVVITLHIWFRARF